MDIFERYNELKECVKIGSESEFKHPNVELKFFAFKENHIHTYMPDDVYFNIYPLRDNLKTNSIKYYYPVFKPKNSEKSDKAILFFHGFNDQDLIKYFLWAEYLCVNVQVPVIMFPIATSCYDNEEEIKDPIEDPSVEKTLKDIRKQRSLSRFNISEKLLKSQIQLFLSGKQSFDDLNIIIKSISSGKHSCFTKNCKLDVFAYSIGAFLAQVSLMLNPRGLFDDSKIVFFCGGSILNKVNAKSKQIIDKKCLNVLTEYYSKNEWVNKSKEEKDDEFLKYFLIMLARDNSASERHNFFESLNDRLKISLLKRDNVITIEGVYDAVGDTTFRKCVEILDFVYPYSHDYPFPIKNNIDKIKVSNTFNQTFSEFVKFYL